MIKTKGFDFQYIIDKTANASLTQELQKMSEQHNSLLLNIIKAMEPIHEIIERQQKAFSPLEKIFQESIIPILKPYKNILWNNQDLMRPFIIKNTIRGMNFYVSDISLLKILNAKEILINRDIEYTVIKFYTDNEYKELVRLMHEWENHDFIKDRIHILNSCIESIQRLPNKNAADVVIPTLFAQIDGITKNFYSIIDPEISNKKYIKHHNFLKTNAVLNNAPASVSWDIFIIIHYLFYFDTGINLTESKDDNDKVFAKASDEQLKNYVLNRNGVMHGIICNYGTSSDLIRIVLCCDTMIKTISRFLDYITEYKKEDDNK